MSDSTHKIEIKVVDATKPSGPKPPKTRDTVIHLIILALIFSYLGILDAVIISFGHLMSQF